jgi:hypothetical protein
MKVLLMHPEDRLLQRDAPDKWDLIVDFGRAPISTYNEWSRRAGCPVMSLYDFGREVEDLFQTRNLLQLGMGRLLDRSGIDWWDILSLEIAPQFQQLMLVHRLANDLPQSCELYTTRPFPMATALRRLCHGALINLESGVGSALRSVRHYSDALSNLNAAQVVQVLQDKFDPEHEFRRRLAPREGGSGKPVVLLPSAYIGVSRVAVSYAALLPEVQFLLACARANGELQSLPANVRMVSLDSYFASASESETADLSNTWSVLKESLIRTSGEFECANAVGVLGRIPSLISWGIALRDAWSRVFEREDIAGCLCADDSNPYSRIPLILAKQSKIPALACHHGAMDAWMAVKTRHADFYLAKGEMERDYLVRTCRVPPQQIILGAPAAANPSLIEVPYSRSSRPWLVFFTEAYHTAAWRSEEVYGELLPRLAALARACGLELVFKLHPFESVEAHRRMLRRLLPKSEAARIHVIAGAPSAELWDKMRFALTGQSTVAVECTARNIPVFLCAWLRDSYTGYVQQYARFGIGQILDSAEQFADIPGLLELQSTTSPVTSKLRQVMNPETLRELLCGNSVVPLAAQG